MIRLVLFITALFLSGVAAYYSIIGLTAIFTGAFYSILLMGGALEVAKLVTISWLYRNWDIMPRLMRGYMTAAVIILMFITSMGIFGFLSKAHLEHSATASAGVEAEVSGLTTEIKLDEKIVSDVDRQLSVMDSTVKDYNVMRKQSAMRKELQKTRKEAQLRLRDNGRKLAQAELEIKKVEVEVGPLKYIAELIYGDDAKKHFDDAVRWVIILLIAVFDPLAVMLLMAANSSYPTQPIKRKRGRPPKTIQVHERDIFNLEKFR